MIIPEVIWSGIIASVITITGTLGGIAISNRSNTRRLRDQLSHDAALKEKERTFQVRREAFMRVQEEVAAAKGMIAKLPQFDAQQFSTLDSSKLSAALAQSMLVASDAASQKLEAFGEQFTLKFLRLMGMQAELQNARGSANALESIRQQRYREVAEIDAEIFAAQRTGHVEPLRYEAMRDDRTWRTKNIDEISDEWDKHMVVVNRELREFPSKLRAAFKELIPSEAEALVAMRHDLGFPSDSNSLIERSYAAQERMYAALESTVSGFMVESES